MPFSFHRGATSLAVQHRHHKARYTPEAVTRPHLNPPPALRKRCLHIACTSPAYSLCTARVLPVYLPIEARAHGLVLYPKVLCDLVLDHAEGLGAIGVVADEVGTLVPTDLLRRSTQARAEGTGVVGWVGTLMPADLLRSNQAGHGRREVGVRSGKGCREECR